MLSPERAMEAAKKKHGTSELARRLELTRQAVQQWDKCPPEWVLAVERETEVSRELLRPDLYPPTRGEPVAGKKIRRLQRNAAVVRSSGPIKAARHGGRGRSR